LTELKNPVETLSCGSRSHSISISPKLVFLSVTRKTAIFSKNVLKLKKRQKKKERDYSKMSIMQFF